MLLLLILNFFLLRFSLQKQCCSVSLSSDQTLFSHSLNGTSNVFLYGAVYSESGVTIFSSMTNSKMTLVFIGKYASSYTITFQNAEKISKLITNLDPSNIIGLDSQLITQYSDLTFNETSFEANYNLISYVKALTSSEISEFEVSKDPIAVLYMDNILFCPNFNQLKVFFIVFIVICVAFVAILCCCCICICICCCVCLLCIIKRCSQKESFQRGENIEFPLYVPTQPIISSDQTNLNKSNPNQPLLNNTINSSNFNLFSQDPNYTNQNPQNNNNNLPNVTKVEVLEVKKEEKIEDVSTYPKN